MSKTDSPDLVAHYLRTIAGDGSMEWVSQPIQASTLLDAADLLDGMGGLIRDMWDGMCGYTHDCRVCDHNAGTARHALCEYWRRMREMGVVDDG